VTRTPGSWQDAAVGFERHDRVRLTKEEDGVPAGSEGVVMGAPISLSTRWVQFFTHGAHEVPEESLETVEPKAE